MPEAVKSKLGELEEVEIIEKVLLRLVICNRLVNLGISKQQHLYLKTEFNLKTQT